MKHHSLHRRICLLAIASTTATLGLAACGGGAVGTSAAAPEPSAPAPFLYGSLDEVYQVISAVSVDQGPMGTSNFTLRYYLHATAARPGATDGLTFTIDSVTEATGPTISSADVSAAAGTQFTGSLSPEGEIADLEGEETNNELVNQLREGLSRFFPRIPPGGAAPGATWADSLNTDSPAGEGVNIHLTLHTQYEALDWGEYHGAQALHVRTNGKYSISGGGSSMGAEFTLDGTGNRHGEVYLGADGVFLGAVSTDTSEATAIVTAAGMSIPITQIRADTIQVIR